METIRFINKILQICGIQIKKYPPLDIRRRISIFKHYGINKILDIGANSGYYGLEMREFGYKGEIVSFEPLSEAYNLLLKNSFTDTNWQVFNFAIGDYDGETIINKSKNSVSSSILELLPIHYENEKESGYISKEIIKIHKLDTIFDNYYNQNDKILLKIDTQGYEKKVLDGAKNTINKISGIQMELSLVPLYAESPNFLEMIEYIKSLGFLLCSIENGFYEPKTGKLLQFDGIFFKEGDCNSE